MMLYSSQWFTQSLAEVCSSRPSEGVVRGGCANLATFAAPPPNVLLLLRAWAPRVQSQSPRLVGNQVYQEYNEQQQRMVSNSPCYDTPTS